MKMNQELKEFEEYLRMQEKSRNTVEKYLRDVGVSLPLPAGAGRGRGRRKF